MRYYKYQESVKRCGKATDENKHKEEDNDLTITMGEVEFSGDEALSDSIVDDDLVILGYWIVLVKKDPMVQL